MQGKQAKIVSPTQERAILGYLITTRYPARDRVMFLLSMKAGLRAKEMASLIWAMVTDAQGQVADVMHVPNRASKGKTGGRTIPLHPDLQAALVTLQTARGDMATPERPILFSERGGGLSPATVRLWFHRLYTSLKMDGCSSHSGRRTFITRAARRVGQGTSVLASATRVSAGAEGKGGVVSRLDEQRCRRTRLLPHMPEAQNNAKHLWRVLGVRHTRRGTVRKTPACLPRALPGPSAPAYHISAGVHR
jgi:integrase/recombinase XerD